MVDKIAAAGLDPDYIQLTADTQNAFLGNIAHTEKAFSILSGSITPTRDRITVTSETGVSDTLSNIVTTSLGENTRLLVTATATHTVTVEDAAGGAGQIHLLDGVDFIMSGDEAIMLERRGADWYELWRSSNSFGSSFTSATTALAVDTVYTLAHGLGQLPNIVQAYIICTSADAGYAVDDCIPVSAYNTDGATGDRGIQISYNTTNVVAVTGAGIQVIDLSTKNANNLDITTPKWSLVAKAWL